METDAQWSQINFGRLSRARRGQRTMVSFNSQAHMTEWMKSSAHNFNLHVVGQVKATEGERLHVWVVKQL